MRVLIHSLTCGDMKEMFEGTNEQSVDTAVIQCQNNPCQNDGTCMLTTNQYECNCIEGFSGKHCEGKSALEKLSTNWLRRIDNSTTGGIEG